MPIHRLGPGTVNVPLNLLIEERQMFGELAISEDRSLGDIIRRLAIDGLRAHDAVAAGKIEELRHARHRAILFGQPTVI